MEQPVTSTSTYAQPEDSRSQKVVRVGGMRMREQTTHLQLVNPQSARSHPYVPADDHSHTLMCQ